jgi:MFS family permease
MHILNFTGWRELPSAPRRFLLFSAINVISWQCIVGQILVLFARTLDMPPTWVGLLIACLPLSMLLVVVTVPLVEWLGPRWILTWGWLLRNLIATSVFAIPWAQAHWGQAGAWQVLLFATVGFCAIRALGVGGWFPWLHEVVPTHQQGLYFATETAVAQVVTVLFILGSGLILGQGITLTPFFLVYGLGIGAGLLSVVAIQFIPGGCRTPRSETPAHSETSYGPALRDRLFIDYVLRTMLGLTALTAQSSAAVMYLRDILGYSAGHIMFLIGSGSLLIAMFIGSLGRRADRYGSSPVMIELLLAHSLVALLWLGLIPGYNWTDPLALLVVAGAALFNAGFLTVATRGMMCRVRELGRVGYTNLWIFGSSMAMGLIPIVAGLLIGRWEMLGFRLCFVVSGIVGILAAFTLRRLPLEEGKVPIPNLGDLLAPVQPLRSLARVLWLNLGLPGEKGGKPANRQ